MSIIEGKRILIIDDEVLVRESIESFLSDLGFVVIQADDGRQGLDVFRDQKPDIILVDLRMPLIDGLDVLAAVTKESPYTPIIVVSGTGVLHDAIEALRLGAWDFITKPIYDMAVLEHSVEKALERANLLKENARYKTYLEEEVQRRTAALEKKNQEFLKAKEEAEAANLAKSRFLTAMSHELRTPMNGVLGMAQLGLYTELSLQQRKYFEVILQSGQALLKILNEILDLSSIEANKTQIEEIEFDLDETIEGIVHLFSSTADTKDLSLECSIPVNISNKLIGDPNRLSQILSNLLANALKFTDTGTIELTIDELEASEETASLRFGVRDTGIGISEGQLSQIFEPFTQVDNSATRKFSGTGLGLSIVSNLVELLNGKVEVESTVDVGSTFWITLPFLKQKDVGNDYHMPDFKGAKLLIVDSQASRKSFMHTHLADWGLQIYTAYSGLVGLEILKTAFESNAPFDAVLIDYQLPDINGVQFCEKASIDHSIPIHRILITTAVDHEKVREASKSVGVAICLPKPTIRMSTLQQAFQDILLDKTPIESKFIPRQDKDKTILKSNAQKIISKPQLLVVEDDQINRMVIVGMLEKLGYRVETASNGKEALACIRRGAYHLIFMDCLMPEMDGFEATKEIRSIEKEKGSGVRIPVIAFTAKAMKGDRELCIAAGMDDYLPKPVKSEDLQSTLDRFLT